MYNESTGGVMKEKKNIGKKVYRARGARLTIDCSAEQTKKITMLAAAREEEKDTWCPLGLSHIPNAETIVSIEASEKGIGVKSFSSMDALFKDLGI